MKICILELNIFPVENACVKFYWTFLPFQNKSHAQQVIHMNTTAVTITKQNNNFSN